MSEKKRVRSDEAVHYDAGRLREENDQRSAAGLPPLQERKRKAADRERLRALRMMVSPMAAEDINPDYQLVPACPATRRPGRERAKRALDALFPSGMPDAATLPIKLLEGQVNAWLTRKGLRAVGSSTIRRAAGRP